MKKIITSKQIISLLESAKTYKYFGRELTVYTNPSRSDYIEMLKDAKRDFSSPHELSNVRFIADNKTKKVYVADSYYSIHDEIRYVLNIPSDKEKGTQLDGVAFIKSIVTPQIGSCFIPPDPGKTVLTSIDWSWVDNYIPGRLLILREYKMITAKQILKLAEVYLGAKNVSGTYTIIYDNPTSSDLKDLNLTMNSGNSRRVVRFIANTKAPQKVFIWDAWNAHHTQMRPVLGYNLDSLSDYRVMDGYAILSSSNKLTFDDWSDFDTDWMSTNKANPKWSNDIVPFLKSFLAGNWSWLDKYIAGSSAFLNKCKQKFEQRVKG